MSWSKNNRFLQGFLGSSLLLYPYVVYKFLNEHTALYYVIGAIFLVILRGFQLSNNKIIGKNINTLVYRIITLVILVAIVMIVLYKVQAITAPLYYPVIMSLGMSLLFFSTVFYPPTLIEIFANIYSAPGIIISKIYCKKLTIIWGCFGIINAAIAFITVWLHNLTLWTLYNGLLSYCLMGLLFFGEMLYRKKYLKKIMTYE